MWQGTRTPSCEGWHACTWATFLYISGLAWNWSCKLVIFLPCFILTWSFLTLFAECIAQPLVPLSLAEGPPEGCVAGSLLSDVLLCLASTVWVKQQNDFGLVRWNSSAAALVDAWFQAGFFSLHYFPLIFRPGMGPPRWWEAKFDIKRSCREHLFH